MQSRLTSAATVQEGARILSGNSLAAGQGWREEGREPGRIREWVCHRRLTKASSGFQTRSGSGLRLCRTPRSFNSCPGNALIRLWGAGRRKFAPGVGNRLAPVATSLLKSSPAFMHDPPAPPSGLAGLAMPRGRVAARE